MMILNDNDKKFIEFISDLLGIENDLKIINVQITNQSVARLFPYEKKLHINFELIKNKLELYNVLAHEIRHYYQHKAIQLGYEEEEILSKWNEEFKNYRPYGTEKYDLQSIEIDSNAFSQFVMYELFSVKLNIIETNSKYLKKVSQFYDEYEKEEFNESLRYSGFSVKEPLLYH